MAHPHLDWALAELNKANALFQSPIATLETMTVKQACELRGMILAGITEVNSDEFFSYSAAERAAKGQKLRHALTEFKAFIRSQIRDAQ